MDRERDRQIDRERQIDRQIERERDREREIERDRARERDRDRERDRQIERERDRERERQRERERDREIDREIDRYIEREIERERERGEKDLNSASLDHATLCYLQDPTQHFCFSAGGNQPEAVEGCYLQWGALRDYKLSLTKSLTDSKRQGFLMPNPLYTYITNIYDLVWLGFMAYQPL